MSPVATWLRQVAERAKIANDRAFASLDAAEADAQAVEMEIPAPHDNSDLTDELLHAVHEKLKCSMGEAHFWRVFLSRNCGPLPESIAHDLIDRDIAVVTMAHTGQANAILSRLARAHLEARLALVARAYTDSSVPSPSFKNALQRYEGDIELLTTVAHLAPSGPDKEATLREVARSQLAGHGVIRILDANRRVARACQRGLEPDEYRLLFNAGEPAVLLALATNPATPSDVLENLIAARNIKFAANIRASARKALDLQRQR